MAEGVLQHAARLGKLTWVVGEANLDKRRSWDSAGCRCALRFSAAMAQ